MGRDKTQAERIAKIETAVEFILKGSDEFKSMLANHDKNDVERISKAVKELKWYIDLRDAPIKDQIDELKKSNAGKVSKSEVRLVYVTLAVVGALFEFFKWKVV